jgi:hypothetical protein
MTDASRRFPPPWTVDEYRDIAYIVRNANKFAVAYGGPQDHGQHRQVA